jgi:hypothetical protein
LRKEDSWVCVDSCPTSLFEKVNSTREKMPERDGKKNEDFKRECDSHEFGNTFY